MLSIITPLLCRGREMCPAPEFDELPTLDAAEIDAAETPEGSAEAEFGTIGEFDEAEECKCAMEEAAIGSGDV